MNPCSEGMPRFAARFHMLDEKAALFGSRYGTPTNIWTRQTTKPGGPPAPLQLVPPVTVQEDEAFLELNRKLGNVEHGGSDRSRPYWYLGGPMSNRPGFNFARFHEVAENLRGRGYNILSPAELDHESERKRLEASNGEPDAEDVTPWVDCLARDVALIVDKNCQGCILLEDWKESKGADFETLVAQRLEKPLFEYEELSGGGLCLTLIERPDMTLDEMEEAQSRPRITWNNGRGGILPCAPHPADVCVD